MPSLKAFGRRWNLASDDFVFPQLSEAGFRLTWLVAAGGLFFLHSPTQCKSLEWLVYLVFLLAANVLTTFACVALAIASARGSILEVQARRWVVKLLYLRVPLFLVEVVGTIASAIYTFGFMESAECFNQNALRATVILELFLIASVFFGIFIVLSPQRDNERNFQIEQRYWSRAMTLCKIGQENLFREALDEIAGLLAAFFARTDYVPSDILAGLLLLVHSPEQQRPPPPLRKNEMPALVDWMSLPVAYESMYRMMDFALAIYGWPSYLLNNRSCGAWCKLYKKVKCCNTCRNRQAFAPNDNCCSCHQAAFLLEAKLNEADIFFCSFRNRLYKVPFVVLADHKTASIVVTIRGFFFAVRPRHRPVDERRPLHRRRRARSRPEQRRGARLGGTLDETSRAGGDLRPASRLLAGGRRPLARCWSRFVAHPSPEADVPDGQVLLVLPPAVVSEHGVKEMEEYVLGVVVGDDLVPRISYQSLMHLKTEIDRQLVSTRLAKYEILIKGIFKLFFASPWDLSSGSRGANERARQRLIESRENYGARLESAGEETEDEDLMKRIRLYPPGRLLHLLPNGSKVEANWIEKEFLSDIELTGNILSDHMPNRVRRVLRRVRDENVTI
ncbi:Lipase-3 domain-containing protein [Aphelenchoides fujianensis]|nr:Lipase-3 domain-containing protein [Aphelenchoides fujianensis]